MPERLTSDCPFWKVPDESFTPKDNAPLLATSILPEDSIDKLFKFLIEYNFFNKLNTNKANEIIIKEFKNFL